MEGKVINVKSNTLGDTKKEIIPKDRNFVCSQDIVNLPFIVFFLPVLVVQDLLSPIIISL